MLWLVRPTNVSGASPLPAGSLTGKVALALRFEPKDESGKSRLSKEGWSEHAAIARKARNQKAPYHCIACVEAATTQPFATPLVFPGCMGCMGSKRLQPGPATTPSAIPTTRLSLNGTGQNMAPTLS